MLIIGCDYHPGFQQIAFVDTDTGEAAERRLTHRDEAEQFYRSSRHEGCV
jgi:transposase